MLWARHNACRARFCIKRKGAMLDNRQLDLWADGYDKSTGLADEAQTYPFAGYKAVLHAIYGRILASEAKAVLDIGFGTGVLAARLYEQGLEIYGWKRFASPPRRNPLSSGGIVCNDRRVAVKGWIK